MFDVSSPWGIGLGRCFLVEMCGGVRQGGCRGDFRYFESFRNVGQF